jgi:hypothetical protein
MKRSMPSIIQHRSNRHSATIRNKKRWWRMRRRKANRRIQRLGDEEKTTNNGDTEHWPAVARNTAQTRRWRGSLLRDSYWCRADWLETKGSQLATICVSSMRNVILREWEDQWKIEKWRSVNEKSQQMARWSGGLSDRLHPFFWTAARGTYWRSSWWPTWLSEWLPKTSKTRVSLRTLKEAN